MNQFQNSFLVRHPKNNKIYKNPTIITMRDVTCMVSFPFSTDMIDAKIENIEETQKGAIIANMALGKDMNPLKSLIIFAILKSIIIPAIIVTLICTIDAKPISTFNTNLF